MLRDKEVFFEKIRWEDNSYLSKYCWPVHIENHNKKDVPLKAVTFRNYRVYQWHLSIRNRKIKIPLQVFKA